MGYDRSDSFPFDFEPNGFPFGSKSKGTVTREKKWKHSFLSIRATNAKSLQTLIYFCERMKQKRISCLDFSAYGIIDV